MKTISKFLLLAGIVVVGLGCEHGPDTPPDTQPDTYETIYNQYNKDKQKEPAPDTLSPLGAVKRSEEPPTDSSGFQNWF